MKIKLLILFVLVFSENLICQNLFSINYNVTDGLPSNTIYYIKQDSKGFIWILTDKGVTRYDGLNYKIFTTEDGLASNDNFNIIIDSKDNIWVYSFLAISKIDANFKIKNIIKTYGNISYFLKDSKDQIFFEIIDNKGLYNKYLIRNDSIIKILNSTFIFSYN